MKASRGSSAEILEFLQSLPLFSELKEASNRSLANACRFRDIDRGEILFFQSDPSDAAFL